MELLPHQEEKSRKLLAVLMKYNMAYLSGETRSMKTLTVLSTAEQYGAKKVLFITKKKGLSSIESDHNKAGFEFEMTAINYESIHKIPDNDFDLVICDESHCISAFPKPSKRTKKIRKRWGELPMILCSGTPATESYSQWYHQFWVSDNSPFEETSFYKWAKTYVNVVQKQIGAHKVNDYSDAKEQLISKKIEPYIVRMTRIEAGLEDEVMEHIISVETPPEITKLAKLVMKKRIVKGRAGTIEANTPASLLSKCHQIYSGSVIIEDSDKNRIQVILSDFKAKSILRYFGEKKIAIMYYFKAELDIIKSVFDVTEDLSEFKNTNKSIALQMNTTEGMNLSEAEAIVYFNIGFSGVKYLQSKQRMTVRGRKRSDVYYIIEKGGTTGKVLKTVQKKEKYNSSMFKRDFL